ncbi:hypothetical protein GCM10011380_02450 [Sphingomonas metalli]|uniref:Short chain dehydrogenase-like proteobacteria domain-containing protein n=1 Tax=Sphingomonas metalli TaxID=1779358 RepID=A0A916SVU1_9SPHN|nr:hypothetical protein [Sphingomonas metalli]GGB16483.1 hypothetical protein GCM10011380_02450 [Sphingomonas metalli]
MTAPLRAASAAAVPDLLERAEGPTALAIVPRPAGAAARALLAATLADIAARRAPMRINLIATGPAVDESAIAAAIAYLEHAEAVTGQLIDIG